MTYLVIHNNNSVTEQGIVNILNRYLENKIQNLSEIYNKPDFYIIEPDEKESITIKQGKKLQHQISYSPFENKYQFVIIPNAQLMTIEAQNSLLKTFEEKSESTIIILAVNNEKAILETILSRSTRMYPKGSILKEENDFTEEEQFLTLPIYDKVSFIEKITKEKKTDEFLLNLIKLFQKKYEINLKTGKNYKEEIRIIEMLKEAQFRIGKNTNKKITLEHICFNLD